MTVRPARLKSSERALLSLRRKAAAAASSMFRRRSSVSAVSELRVISVRYRLNWWSSSASTWACDGSGCTTSTIWRTGRSDASGASGATPKAVTPVPSNKTARVPAMRFGCWVSVASRLCFASCTVDRTREKPSIFKTWTSSLRAHHNPLGGCDGKKSMGSLWGCGDNSELDQQVARQSRIGVKADLTKQAIDYSHLSLADNNENPYESSAFPNFTFVRCGAGGARRVLARLRGVDSAGRLGEEINPL